MPLNRCLAAVRLRDPSARPRVEARLERLARFYAPLGRVAVSQRFVEPLSLLLASLTFDGADVDSEAPLVWGSSLPPAMGTTELLRATDAELRDLPGPLAAMAAQADRGRVVTAAGGVTSLYTATATEAEAWSSHAVAAGWLAGEAITLDLAAIAELVACEFVGGDRTLIEGVRAVPPATVVELAPGEGKARSVWPARERWAPIDAEEAAETADAALLGAVEGMLPAAPAPVLGLTAGLDSLTVAVALRELGVDFRAFTYGVEGSSDLAGAARAAAALGVRHDTGGFDWWDDAEGMERLHAEVRWTEGLAPVGYGTVHWPQPMSHWIAGVGAETGRSFYYRWLGSLAPTPTAATLFRALTLPLASRVVGARRDARRALARRWRSWIEEAMTLGHPGWSSLDVVYAEHRVRRWGRAMVPCFGAEVVHAFADPQLLRLLASLPLDDRLDDGFERRFVAARRPGLVPPAGEPSRGLLPPAVTAAAVARMRGLRRALRLPGLIRRGRPWHAGPPWDERPRYIEWLADHVPSSPLIREALGEQWASDLRRRFVAGEEAAGALTCLAAAPVALDAALRDLGSSPP